MTQLQMPTQKQFYDVRWQGEQVRHVNPHADGRTRLQAILAELMPEYRRKESLRILDHGCGNGWLTRFLSPFGTVTGVDFSEAGVRQAASFYPQHRFIEASVLDDFLPGERFDVVISQEVLEHVEFEEQSKLLECCRSRLVNDGLLILTTPNKWAVVNMRKTSGQDLEKLGDQPQENLLNVGELYRLASKSFEIERLYTVHDVNAHRGFHRLLYSDKLNRYLPGWRHMARLTNAKLHSVLVARPSH